MNTPTVKHFMEPWNPAEEGRKDCMNHRGQGQHKKTNTINLSGLIEAEPTTWEPAWC